MRTTILDASAILAVLRREPGWEVVKDVITESVASAINIGEVTQRQLRLDISRETTEKLLAELELPILPVDPSLAMDAAEIRHSISRAGLSQADCICLALARRMNVTAMTADRAWAGVADEVGVAVEVIR